MAEEKQERTEYRIAYHTMLSGERVEAEVPLADPSSLNEAESRLEGTRSPYRLNVRIQKRTVVEHPWEDVADE